MGTFLVILGITNHSACLGVETLSENFLPYACPSCLVGAVPPWLEEEKQGCQPTSDFQVTCTRTDFIRAVPVPRRPHRNQKCFCPLPRSPSLAGHARTAGFWQMEVVRAPSPVSRQARSQGCRARSGLFPGLWGPVC